MKASRLKKKPKHLHNFTGLTVEQFEELCNAVSKTVSKQTSKAREHAFGGGRKSELSLENQVLVILIYYRLKVTQILLGYLFHLDESNISRLISKLPPSLLEVLPLPAQETLLFAKPEGSKRRISSLGELLGVSCHGREESRPSPRRCLTTHVSFPTRG